MYRDQPKSLAQQKDAVRHHISGINSEMIFNASQGIFHSLTSVLISNRGHFEKLQHLDTLFLLSELSQLVKVYKMCTISYTYGFALKV